MSHKLKYKNITISGLPGAGSSTLGKALAEVLKWKYFSGGDFLRAMAIKQGVFSPRNKYHHDQSILSDDTDLKVDFGMRKTLQNESGNILDSWLSGFMAQCINGTLKILAYCSEDVIRVDRIVNRDNLTVKDAKNHIFEREKKNLKKWRRMYKNQWKDWVVNKGLVTASKPIWFWYPELYDLTIDTYKFSKEETLKIALREIGFKKKVDFKQIFPS